MKTCELESMFNVTANEIAEWDEGACKGSLPGKPSKKVVYGPGRPQLFGETMKQIGFREPVSKANIIEIRANTLGLKRSDYLRTLVDDDLRKVGLI